MKCEISQSPMISYRSPLFIATAMNDKIKKKIGLISVTVRYTHNFCGMFFPWFSQMIDQLQKFNA